MTTKHISISQKGQASTDVDLPEGLAQAVRDVDHNSLPAPGNIHLAAKSQQASSPNVQTKNHRLLHLNRRQ